VSFTASGQTITTFNYIQKGKVYARTTTITVKGKVVNRAGQLVGWKDAKELHFSREIFEAAYQEAENIWENQEVDF